MLLGISFWNMEGQVCGRSIADIFGCGVSPVGKGAVLPYDCDRELVVSLRDQCYCVTVSGLELERVSGACAGVACCVDEYEHFG